MPTPVKFHAWHSLNQNSLKKTPYKPLKYYLSYVVMTEGCNPFGHSYAVLSQYNPNDPMAKIETIVEVGFYSTYKMGLGFKLRGQGRVKVEDPNYTINRGGMSHRTIEITPSELTKILNKINADRQIDDGMSARFDKHKKKLEDKPGGPIFNIFTKGNCKAYALSLFNTLGVSTKDMENSAGVGIQFPKQSGTLHRVQFTQKTFIPKPHLMKICQAIKKKLLAKNSTLHPSPFKPDHLKKLANQINKIKNKHYDYLNCSIKDSLRILETLHLMKKANPNAQNINKIIQMPEFKRRSTRHIWETPLFLTPRTQISKLSEPEKQAYRLSLGYQVLNDGIIKLKTLIANKEKALSEQKRSDKDLSLAQKQLVTLHQNFLTACHPFKPTSKKELAQFLKRLEKTINSCSKSLIQKGFDRNFIDGLLDLFRRIAHYFLSFFKNTPLVLSMSGTQNKAKELLNQTSLYVTQNISTKQSTLGR